MYFAETGCRILCAAAMLLPAAIFAQDSLPADSSSVPKKQAIQLHGYVKDLQNVSFTDQPGSLSTGNLVHNRLNLRWDMPRGFYLRLECRNRLFYGEQIRMNPFAGNAIDRDDGFFDLSWNIAEGTALVLNSTIDRALLNWSSQKWDISIGRQRINWGVNMVWNPNDIFNAFNYFDFDYEERPGNDAVRVQFNTGNRSTIEFAMRASDKTEQLVSAVLYKTNFRKYDWQSFAGVCREDLVAGAGWAGNIGNTGFKGEASWFQPYKNFTDSSGTLSASVSLDRSFGNSVFAMASYLCNSSATSATGDIRSIAASTLSAKKLMPFKHSFFIQASKSITPLLNTSLATIYSPEKNTLIIFPSLGFSVSNNWEVSLLAQSFFSEVAGTYRSPGSSVYFRLRWSY